jgi:hypothetical protein
LPPERCIDPDDLFPELERRGVRFEVSDDTAEGAEGFAAALAGR